LKHLCWSSTSSRSTVNLHHNWIIIRRKR